MQCSSLTFLCLRTQWGGESIWALENLSLGLSVPHPPTVHWWAVLIWCLQLDASVSFWGGTGCDREVCVKARATRARPFSLYQAGRWHELQVWVFRSHGSGGTVVASSAVQNAQSQGRWVRDRHGVKKVADSVLPLEILKYQMNLSGANFKYHNTPHCPYPFAPVLQY